MQKSGAREFQADRNPNAMKQGMDLCVQGSGGGGGGRREESSGTGTTARRRVSFYKHGKPPEGFKQRTDIN